MGGVIVIHENRGLTDHIKDVTRRAAKAGYIAMAPDALSETAERRPMKMKRGNRSAHSIQKRTSQFYQNQWNFYAQRKECNRKVGCVGFCWGGGLANQLAVNVPNLNAAVAFYGAQPKAEDVPKIKAPLLLHYGA
jgi:carboxymethylenebutenolidase